MKTSNKILIAFLILLFSGITALYVGSKYNSGYYNTQNFETQEKPLPNFSVIVAQANTYFQIMSGKKNKIKHRFLKDTKPKIGAWVVKNDTLFISCIQLKKNEVWDTNNTTTIFCKNSKSIIIKENSTIKLEDFNAKTLTISINKSFLEWNFENIASVSIQAKDSQINLEGEKLEKLVLKLDKSRINSRISERTTSVSGSLINSSNLRYKMSHSARLTTDDTSNYDFY